MTEEPIYKVMTLKITIIQHLFDPKKFGVWGTGQLSLLTGWGANLFGSTARLLFPVDDNDISTNVSDD